MINPFTLGIVTGNDFCNRSQEKRELASRAMNSQNVVLCAKRLIGKSSLVKQVLKEVAQQGLLTVYTNIFSISSEKEFISKLAAAIATGIYKRASDHRSWGERFAHLFSKIRIGVETSPQGVEFTAGFDKTMEFTLLLEDLMIGLYRYVEEHGLRAVIAIDEFQEITELPTPKKIEGTLRQYMQEYRNISYIYVGSRRRALLEMFTDKKRPFYKSAFTHTLEEISKAEFAPYISAKFTRSGKQCPLEVAHKIYEAVSGYSYYVQKLSSLCWDLTETKCSGETVKKAYAALLAMEAPSDFEGIVGGLSLGQKAVLKAIAKEPTSSPFARDYLAAHSLSQGSVQRAIEALTLRDLIEKKNGVYRLTDPVMGEWLNNTI